MPEKALQHPRRDHTAAVWSYGLGTGHQHGFKNIQGCPPPPAQRLRTEAQQRPQRGRARDSR